MDSVINKTACTALHLDIRDVGLGGIPMASKPYTDSGMKLLGCDKKVLQFVTVISFKNYENDALFGLTRHKVKSCFTLKCPPFDSSKEADDSIRIVTYAMDFSDTLHGNILYEDELDEDSWALRITSYATNHSATWNEWFKQNSNDECSNILKTMIGKNNNNN